MITQTIAPDEAIHLVRFIFIIFATVGSLVNVVVILMVLACIMEGHQADNHKPVPDGMEE